MTYYGDFVDRHPPISSGAVPNASDLVQISPRDVNEVDVHAEYPM